MNRESKHFFEFAVFRVDVEERRLLRNGETVALTAKVFDILLALVKNSGRTITKDEIIGTVWSDTFVEEGNLSQHISTLRKILGDDPHQQRFIRTIPKLGYRFTNDVREVKDDGDGTAIESVSRTRLIIREETLGGFWTPSRVVIASILFVGIGMFISSAFSIFRDEKWKKYPAITNKAEAFEPFEKGRALWNNRKPESLHEATLLLENSVQIDPSFALGHAALADAYAFDYANWKNAAGQANLAIALDPDLGEPHASLGFVEMFWQWNLPAAETELKIAIANSPGYATGHQWFAANLAAMGRTDAALSEIKKAIDLDPSSIAIRADHCQLLYFAERNEEALTECKKVLDLDPKNITAHQYIFEIYSNLKMDEESVNKFIENRIVMAGELRPEVETNLRTAYRQKGIDGFRRAQLEFFQNDDPYYFHIAKVYARLGETDKAFGALSISCERKEWDFIFLADPVFKRLRYDPRMTGLISRLHSK